MNYTIYINYLIVILFGVILGALSAIPVGAVQVEVAKKAINGHLMPAIATALGSATSDLIYGMLTLFSLGNFLFDTQFQITTYIIGILVLCFLFFRSYREYKHNTLEEENSKIYKKRLSYLTGFTIAITNPGIVIWWIVGYKILIDLSLFTVISPLMKIIFILSGCAGLGGYLVLIAFLLNRMQQAVSERFLMRMNKFLMILLTILIVYFIVKVVSIAFNYNLNIP